MFERQSAVGFVATLVSFAFDSLAIPQTICKTPCSNRPAFRVFGDVYNHSLGAMRNFLLKLLCVVRTKLIPTSDEASLWCDVSEEIRQINLDTVWMARYRSSCSLFREFASSSIRNKTVCVGLDHQHRRCRLTFSVFSMAIRTYEPNRMVWV